MVGLEELQVQVAPVALAVARPVDLLQHLVEMAPTAKS